LAEMRDHRKALDIEEFRAKTANLVRRKKQVQTAYAFSKAVIQGEQIKKIIHETVMGYYSKPKKYNRQDSSNESRDGGPIRDLVNEKGPMASKTLKSVDFSRGGKSEKTNTADGKAKLIEINTQ